MLFGPQANQNPNIETVVVKVFFDEKGKVSRLSISVVISGTNPPVPSNRHEIPPPKADFSALVERLLLENK